jgi:hypothetical protein
MIDAFACRRILLNVLLSQVKLGSRIYGVSENVFSDVTLFSRMYSVAQMNSFSQRYVALCLSCCHFRFSNALQ